MKKTLFGLLLFITIAGGIALSLYMMNKEQKNAQKNSEENYNLADKVTDECIDEYNDIQVEDIEEANSKEAPKLSPNSIIKFEKFYKKCEHTINRYEGVSDNLVNATREDIEKKYNTWEVKDFSKDEVVLYQEVDDECGEHYMLRDVDGKINIYKLDENGNEALINETDIATEYLTETDMINMDNGLIVYGKESLNKLLEDFE